MVTIFDKIHKEYLGNSKCAKTWKFLMGICLFKVDNRNTGTRCEVCSKLWIKTPEQCQCRHSGVFFLNSEHISHLVLVLLLLLWTCKYLPGCFSKSIKGCTLLYLFWHYKANSLRFYSFFFIWLLVVAIFLTSLGIPGNL